MSIRDYVVCCVVNEDDGSVTQPVGFDSLGQARKWFAGYVKEYNAKVGFALMRLVKLCNLSLDVSESLDLAGEPSYSLDGLRVNGKIDGWTVLVDVNSVKASESLDKEVIDG